MADQAPNARPKHRSPSYPAIDLATALARTTELWDHAQRHFVPMTSATGVWGYKPKSSGGLQTVAAMKSFGLLDDEGSGERRQVRVSDLGRLIVTDEPGSAARQERIQHAALMPKIHRELWEEHDGSLPPDSRLRFDLVNNRAFGESAARDLIDEFRKTLAFAGLTAESDTVSPTYQDEKETPTPRLTNAPPLNPGLPAALSGYQLPVGPGRFAVLQGPFPVTEDQWELMLSVLKAMKPGLVAESATEPGEDS
jgi:hypothetical protein